MTLFINVRTYLPVVWNLILFDSSWDSATIALKAQDETKALSVQCLESTLLTCSQAFKLPEEKRKKEKRRKREEKRREEKKKRRQDKRREWNEKKLLRMRKTQGGKGK